MMPRQIVLLILAMVVALTCPSMAKELPPPPKGYVWVSDVENEFYLFKPEDWFFKKGTKNGTLGYFISKEKIEGGSGEFTTGLTINVLKDIKKKTGLHPSTYAYELRKVAIRLDTALRVWDQRVNHLPGFGYVTKIAQPPKAAIIAFNFIIANDAADKAFLIVFESLEPTWKDAWERGAPMLEALGIDTAACTTNGDSGLR